MTKNQGACDTYKKKGGVPLLLPHTFPLTQQSSITRRLCFFTDLWAELKTMAGNKVLVLGATGPAGICVLRELLHRGTATLVFCRSPNKLPQDLVDNGLLEVRAQRWNEETAS